MQHAPPAAFPQMQRIAIEQEEYRSGTAQMYLPAASPIQFWVNGVKGIRVIDALYQRFDGLADQDALLLDNVGAKVSIRIEMPGYPSFVRQKYVHRTTRSQESISRKQLAARIAEVIEAFVTASTNIVSDTPRLLFGPGNIELQDLFLVEVRHVSKGSLQPVLEYTPRWNPPLIAS